MIVRVNNLAASDEVSTTDIYYSGQQVIEEGPRLPSSPASDAAAVAHQYVYSPRSVNTPILDTQTSYTVVSSAWASATATYYFLTDANDNVTAVTDASGAVQERYVYSAFGTTTIYNSDYSATRTVSSVNNTILFAGMTIDPDTGLYKDGARFYSSLTSSFLTPDPAQQGNNWYEYSGNDPADETDPTGLLWGDGPGGGSGFDAPNYPCSSGEQAINVLVKLVEISKGTAEFIVKLTGKHIKIRNSQFIDSAVSLADLAAFTSVKADTLKALEAKFGKKLTVTFDKLGQPNFTPFRKTFVTLPGIKAGEPVENYANQAWAALQGLPEYKLRETGQYDWHHAANGDLELVDKQLHRAFQHTGLNSVLKQSLCAAGLLIPGSEEFQKGDYNGAARELTITFTPFAVSEMIANGLGSILDELQAGGEERKAAYENRKTPGPPPSREDEDALRDRLRRGGVDLGPNP